MPIINVEGPHINIDTKRKLADGLARVASDAYGMPLEDIIVLIKENSPENVYVNGRLVSDR